ncbi:hypothetical protein [Agrococcus sp. DT81.2]|uniref:hypothetical protein n=1 Tax=Agrococcus sp. DT81.2 TaxID=3393414 RepID=UPI003CE4A83C
MSGIGNKISLRDELAKIRERAERHSPAEKAQAAMMAHRLRAFSTKPEDVAAVRSRDYWE